MNKKVGCALICSLMIVIGAGCGQKPLSDAGSQTVLGSTNNQEVSTTETATSTENNTPVKDQVSETKEQQASATVETTGKVEAPKNKEDNKEQSLKIQVYFTDPQAMELKKAEDEIQFVNNTEKYQNAFKALQDDSDPELISLWSKMQLKTISFSAGLVTLDIHMPDEARLGAGGEQFALESLKNTLFQFEEVKSIELLVDGEAVETLMGHADLEHPMVRE